MKTAPDPKDILDFQFKLLNNRQIFEGYDAVPATCNLVAVDGKRGLILTGCNNKITLIRSGDTSDNDWRREHILPDRISRLAVDCDCSFVAVTFVHPTAYIYDAASFVQQELKLLRQIKLSSTENVHVLDLKWNPCIPGMLCTVTSDHMVGSFSVSNDKNTTLLTVVEKISGLEVSCVAWSPKGKQLVAGCKNGSLIQLKQDLKIARNIAGPNPSIGSVISVLWISNYQFCAAYLDPRDSRINVLIVDAPKGEVNASFTTYDDITFGQSGVNGEEAGPRYYFEHIAEWGTIIAASSGSIEVAVLGTKDNGATWESWQLVDSGRAQLPLVRTSESFPVGLAVDRTSVLKLPWGGENLTLPHPLPILHILGTSGQLCSFHVVNLLPEALPICSAPSETVPSSSQPKLSFAPSELSFNSMSVASSTPQPKQVNPVVDQSKPASAIKLFAEIPNVPTVQQPVLESNVTKVATVEADVILKPETKIIPGKGPKPKEKVSIDQLDSNICNQLFQEECSLFEKELGDRRGLQAIDIGNATELAKLIEDTDVTNRFFIELRETTDSLTSDITYLKALMLQTFAWVEETKSKCSSDPSYDTRTRTDNSKVDYFKNRLFYLQTQLTEAQRALDLQWSEHVNKGKQKMKIPRFEFIYQSMLRHWQILTKEQERIQSLVKKWKMLNRGDVSSLNLGMAKMHVASSDSGNGAIEQRCRTIASRHCSFTQEKQVKLRNLLKNSPMRIIEVANPTPIQDRLKATISSLTSLNFSNAPSEQKIEMTRLPEPQRQETVAAATPSSQPVKHPLASLDQIVASIGWTNEQANNHTQNQYLSTKSITAPLLTKTPTDIKAGLSIPSAMPQTVLSGQIKTNKPVAVPLLSTPQTSQNIVSTNANPVKPVSKPEASPFVTQVTKPMTQSTPLVPSGKPTILVSVTVPSSTLKSDCTPYTSVVKNNVQTVQISSASISATPCTSATMPISTPALQASFSFSSPAVAQKSNLTTEPKPTTTTTPPPPAPTTTKISSALDTFSFASKPSNNTPFSCAVKPTRPTSNISQSLDLSVLGAGLQVSSNTINNVTQAPAATSTSFFGSAATSPPGTIFGGNSEVPKDKPQNTMSNNAAVSSIFGGSMASSSSSSSSTSKILPSFNEMSQNPTEKQKIFGAAASSVAPIFDNSVVDTQKTIFGEVSTSSPSSSIFGSASQFTSGSIFGGITSPTASSSFEENATPLSNASTLMGTSTSIVSPFGGATNQAKSPIFPTESVAPAITSEFGNVVKPSLFGGAASAGASPLSLFGGSSSGSANTSIFGGTASNITPGESIFGGASPRTTAVSIFGGSSSTTASSLFGASSTVSPNESIFGTTAIGSLPMGATSPSPITSSAFGQAPTFGSKPEFGALGFGASKPVFGGGFGSSAFPTSMPTGGLGGFGSLPTLGATSPAMGDNSMQKVFGQASGSSTFEALAGQGGGLTFGNLAQKQPETEAPPEFSGGSSFQSWRCK